MSKHPMQLAMLQLAAQHDIVNMRLVDLAQLLGGNIALQRIKHHRGQLIKRGELSPPDRSKEVTIVKVGDLELLRIPVLGEVS